MEIAYMGAAELAKAIRDKQTSPTEVLDASIDRIEERNPSLNAIVYKGYEDARKRSRQADTALANGQAVGPLHGVPVIMKDLFDFKPGWPTTYGGIPAMRNFSLDAYCVWAERMEAAGAIIVGKGNSPAMGYRGTCDNYLFGATGNPFDVTRNTGGSSGGSAASVADGLVPIAEGSDGGGSIRIPSAWCGVYGFQPSPSRVPTVLRPNAFAGRSPFIYEGPITRNVTDAALAMRVLAGYHPGDPFSLRDEPDFPSVTDGAISGWKIAYSPDLGVYPVAPEVRKVVDEAVKAFEECGAQVTEVEIDLEIDQRELSDLWCRLIMPLNLDAFAGLKKNGLDVMGDHRDDLPPEFLRWFDHVAEMSVMDYFDDNSKRTLVFDALQGVLDEHRLVISPTLACMPPPNETTGETRGPSMIEGVEVDPVIGWCMTYFTNFTGHPAASAPAGLSDGMPVGMQIIGRRQADVDVLRASAAFEQVRPWSDNYRIPAGRSLS